MSDFFQRLYMAIGFIGLSSIFVVKYFYKYRKFKAVTMFKRGFSDHRHEVQETSEDYMHIFSRLCEAFIKAKDEQQDIEEPYRLSPLWQQVIDERSIYLADALRKKDIPRLKDLLENFHRADFVRGSGECSGDYFAARRIPLYKYQYIDTWYRYHDIYNSIASENDQFTYPKLGNPVGLYHQGQVIPIEAIRFRYYASEIISLLQDVDNPVVCEIGGGVGGQAYSILANFKHDITYILFDIPEVLIVASYFLMATLPDKKFLLYGEAPLDHECLKQYDIVLMPNFILPRLEDESADLVFNANSFSEMSRETVTEYISHIERICRKYFMHVNHTARFKWHSDGKIIENMPADQIAPADERFKRIYQHPRVFARLEDKLFYRYHKAKHFAFLYERINFA